MATHEFELLPAPPAHDLWIQHAAGKILFEDVRNYALAKIGRVSDREQALAAKAIDDAIYGLMMVADGVSGSLQGPAGTVEVRLVVRYRPRSGKIEQMDLSDGDGMCMGFHGWRKGDFGEEEIARPREKKPAPPKRSSPRKR